VDKDFFKRLFEQSFLVVALALALYFVFLEYKSVYSSLLEKQNTDEKMLLDRLDKTRTEKDELYERLIDCKDD
tara:strand:+ start:243 stop:461 length:219 start_codon:yes stop_codon:yes gene_type:complete